MSARSMPPVSATALGVLGSLLLVVPALALAQEDPDVTPGFPSESSGPPGELGEPGRSSMPVEADLLPRPRIHDETTRERAERMDRRLAGPVDEVDGSAALDELLDELAVDLARLGARRVGPVLLQAPGLSANMNPRFARVFEARLVNALQRVGNLMVMRCFECSATRSRVEEGEWVVTRGIPRKDVLKELAAEYGARTVLSVDVTVIESPSAIAVDVELLRPEDAAVVFAESYRIDPHTALLYRSADRLQKREERLKDLEARLDARPVLDHLAYIGAAVYPAWEHPEGPIWTATVGYRILERFGFEREYGLGLRLEGVWNPDRLAAIRPMVALGARVGTGNVFQPTCFVSGEAGMLITGTQYNSPVIALTGECLMAHRFALQVQMQYVFPFVLGEGGYDVGGLVPQAGLAVSW